MPTPIDTSPEPESLVSTPVADTTAPSSAPVSTPVDSTPAPAPVSSVSAVPSATPAPAATPAEVAAWQQELGQWGIDYSNFQGPEQAVAFALQSAQGIAEQTRQQLAQREQQLAQYEQQLRSFSQPAAPKPQAVDPNAWNPPEFDSRWTPALELDQATGLYKPAVDGVPAEVVAKANEYAKFTRDWQSEFAKNPYEFMKKGITGELKSVEDRAYERAVQYIEAKQQEQAIDHTVQSTVAKHGEWLYQKDMTGNILKDHTGRRVLSQKGATYYKAVEELARSGVSDPSTQDRLALQMIGHASQAASPASRIEQFAGAPAARNLSEALHTAHPGGSLSPTVPGAVGPSPVEGSFLAMAKQEMAARGISLTGDVVSTI